MNSYWLNSVGGREKLGRRYTYSIKKKILAKKIILKVLYSLPYKWNL